MLPTAVSSTTYDANNRLTKWTTSGGSVTPGYDGDGNMAAASGHTNTWDSRNRLTAISGYPLLPPQKHRQMQQV